jgi:CIC family chloride channel protein
MLDSPDSATGDGGPRGSVRSSRLRRWLSRAVPRGAGFESTRNLGKWLLFGTAIGIVAGLGAVVFFRGIEVVTRVLLGSLVGYLPPAPAGEGETTVVRMARPWLLPLVTTGGGLLSGLIVFALAPEAEGHGTDAAIEAIHRRAGNIRLRVPPVKFIASIITIGSGGSAGREGPAAQISAGFGSLLGRWLLTDPEDRRIAVAAGVGAGIGAIFRAPLGGAVLAAEILYLHDIEVEAIIPSLIASIVGYTLYGAWMGYGPIFDVRAPLALGAPIQLVYYAALGVLSGVGGLLYSKSFYGLTGFFRRLRLPRWLRPALGGLVVGLLGLALPQALHTGYGWVQLIMTKQGLLALPLLLVLAIPFAKILATSLTIGSGGSGGVFGPGMVIGGMLGALFWRLGLGVLPSLPPEPAPFVIIGMMALFGGIAHAPLAVMLMVAEMTGTLSVLAPAMIAVAVSTALVGDETIYREQLRSRASSPLHRARFSVPLLSTMLVRDAAVRAAIALPEHTNVADAESRLAAAGETAAIVLGEQRELVAAVTLEALRRQQAAEPAAPLAAVAARLILSDDMPLDEAMQALIAAGATAAVVRGKDASPKVIALQDILRAYRAALRGGVRRGSGLPLGFSVLQISLSPQSFLTGRSLGDAGLPSEVLVVAIERRGETVFAKADIRFEAGDRVTLLATRRGERDMADLFALLSRPPRGG